MFSLLEISDNINELDVTIKQLSDLYKKDKPTNLFINLEEMVLDIITYDPMALTKDVNATIECNLFTSELVFKYGKEVEYVPIKHSVKYLDFLNNRQKMMIIKIVNEMMSAIKTALDVDLFYGYTIKDLIVNKIDTIELVPSDEWKDDLVRVNLYSGNKDSSRIASIIHKEDNYNSLSVYLLSELINEVSRCKGIYNIGYISYLIVLLNMYKSNANNK